MCTRICMLIKLNSEETLIIAAAVCRPRNVTFKRDRQIREATRRANGIQDNYADRPFN